MKHATKEKFDRYVAPIKQYNHSHPHEHDGTDPVAVLRQLRFKNYIKDHKSEVTGKESV